MSYAVLVNKNVYNRFLSFDDKMHITKRKHSLRDVVILSIVSPYSIYLSCLYYAVIPDMVRGMGHVNQKTFL